VWKNLGLDWLVLPDQPLEGGPDVVGGGGDLHIQGPVLGHVPRLGLVPARLEKAKTALNCGLNLGILTEREGSIQLIYLY